MPYQRNEEGNIINPPVIRDWEQRIYSVMESDPGNTVKIERLTREYEADRTKLAEEEEADERTAAEDQANRDADARQAVANRNPATPAGTFQTPAPQAQTPAPTAEATAVPVDAPGVVT